ncbi:MAG: DUF192 domain-containing protein [Terracidiphilus sp.]
MNQTERTDLGEKGEGFVAKAPPPDPKMVVRNKTRNTQLGDRVDVAGSGAKRTKGLLGRKGLAPGEGMWIVPCESVHTFFMRFPIDLVYIDRKQRVRKVRNSVPPWRLSACLSAHSILELPAGTIQDSLTEAGDILEIVDASQAAGMPSCLITGDMRHGFLAEMD